VISLFRADFERAVDLLDWFVEAPLTMRSCNGSADFLGSGDGSGEKTKADTVKRLYITSAVIQIQQRRRDNSRRLNRPIILKMLYITLKLTWPVLKSLVIDIS
jgi:hypothetical protein